jgi:hypothetical protein
MKYTLAVALLIGAADAAEMEMAAPMPDLP